MNESNDDFDLQDLWQKTPPVDVDLLLKSVTKAQKGMRKLFYFELSGTVGGLLVIYWAYLQKAFGEQVWPLILIGIVAVLFQLWAWSWRRGLWTAVSGSPLQLLQVRRKHLLLDIKIAQSCYWGLGLGAFVGGVMSFFDSSESRLDLTFFERTTVVGGLVIICIGFLVWSIRKEKTARRKLKTVDEKIKEFENEESL